MKGGWRGMRTLQLNAVKVIVTGPWRHHCAYQCGELSQLH